MASLSQRIVNAMAVSRTSAPPRHQEIGERLNNVGLKATDQRLKVLEVMLDHEHHHLSAEDVHAKVSEGRRPVGLGTIYRVLGQLTEVGLLTRHIFHNDANKAVYEVHRRRHDHLICLACDKIEELFADDIAELSRGRAAAKGYTLTQHRLELYGFCAECRRSTRPRHGG
ncbi:MAG: hypothetical protein RL033_7396 [Pseudomonadota bacterium]|jgi:Fur family ferric uptake transcriptional regulator